MASMEGVPKLFAKFFSNSNRLCELLEGRLPKTPKDAATEWRTNAFAVVGASDLVGSLSGAWTPVPKNTTQIKDEPWASVLEILHHELNAIVAQQDAILARAGEVEPLQAQHIHHSSALGRLWRIVRTVMRHGANLLASIQNILTSLPIWAKALLEALRELFEFNAAPSG